MRLAKADAPAKRKGFGETMAFGGWAPEVINGRVAQLAFVAGVGAELVTGETIPAQFHDHVAALTFASTLVALASFMPGVQAKRYTSEPTSKGAFGPFTPGKEMLHGRLAMIGLAAAFLLESQTGHARRIVDVCSLVCVDSVNAIARSPLISSLRRCKTT